MVHWLTLACLLTPVQVSTKPTASAELLPPSTAVVIELNDPVSFLTQMMDHPIHERAKKDRVLAQLYASPRMFQARAGLALGELAIGMKWPDAVKTLAGSGITIAFDPETNGVIAIMRSVARVSF